MTDGTLPLSAFSSPATPWSVAELTHRIRRLLEGEVSFADLWVEGEVSNFSRGPSGHLYFSLKDAQAQIGCVVWKSTARRLLYLPRNGEAVLVHGKLGLYERGGRYQIHVDHIEAAGVGRLDAEFRRLKARLEAEGLFDAARKRPIPQRPRTIGLVTSRGAAALRDVLNVLRRRYPLVRLLLSPTPVQGDEAPPQIVAALRRLDARDDVDLILVVRGGGSLEDLWAFNDERVARAIAAARHPVIAGVGHETDFTLADFAADLRAPTPSAAAEMATPDAAALRQELEAAEARMVRAMHRRLEEADRHLTALTAALERERPHRRIAEAQQRLDELLLRGERALRHRLEIARHRLEAEEAHLEALNPRAVLRRGYAIVRRDDGRPIPAAAQVAEGECILIQWHDGRRHAKVTPPPSPQGRGARGEGKPH